MDLSAPKSSVTLFTPWRAQFARLPPVEVLSEVDGAPAMVEIPHVSNPTLLGLTFDQSFTFSKHASLVASKARSRLNILRALGDTSFGHDKECLLQTYTGLIRPIFNYAAPILYPIYSPESFRKLQLVQSRALRLILGAHQAASIDHLHAEAAILPVEQHLHLLAAQFLARALQPDHPSHDVVQLGPEPGHRDKWDTLRSKCWATVEPFLQNGIVPPGAFEEVKKQIHTKIVSDYIDATGPNRVLNGRPPLIHPSEQVLPRETRVTLGRLRSGFCSNLRDFEVFVGRSDDPVCPECLSFDACTDHLFNCPAFPTSLATTDLWDRPYDAANFIGPLPAFSHLPPPGPPPPPRWRGRRRPPPEPPP